MEAVIPENWDTIEEFAAWFKAAGCPMLLPDDAHIFYTDVSMSIITFRRGDYQAELYMMRPNVVVPKHSHPMKQIILWLGGWIRARFEGADPARSGPLRTKHQGFISPTLDEGKWHGFKTTSKGALLYVLERWRVGDAKTSATLAYHGEPLGPIHKATLDALDARR